MRTKKSLGLTLLSLVMAIALVFGVTSMSNSVKADELTTTVNMQSGASIRLEENNPALIYTAVIENYDANKVYGMLLVENALISGVTDYVAELDGANYQNIVCAPYEKDGANKITAYFDIAMDKLTVDYVGIAYVKDGDAYFYSQVSANNVRSVEYVAQMAYLRGDGDQEVLASFINGAENLEFGVNADVPNKDASVVDANTYLEIVVDKLNQADADRDPVGTDGSTKLSFMSKDAYEEGATVTFDIFVPTEMSGKWIGFNWSTSKRDGLDIYAWSVGNGVNIVDKVVAGGWATVSVSLPESADTDDTYYFWLSAAKGEWNDGAEEDATLYTLKIDNVVIDEPSYGKTTEDFENGFGEVFVRNGNDVKDILAEDVVYTTYVAGTVEIGNPAPEVSAKIIIDRIKSDKGLATFVTKESYPAGSEITFKYLIPADVTSSWFAVNCTQTQEQADIYTDYEWRGSLTVGGWETFTVTLANSGYVSLVGSVGDWGGKDNPVTEGYILIDDFTVTTDGVTVKDTFNKGVDAGLFDVNRLNAVELGEGYIAPEEEDVSGDCMLVFDEGAIGGYEKIAMITDKAYTGVTEVSFKAQWLSTAVSTIWGLGYTSDPTTFKYDSGTYGTDYINCYTPRFGDLKIDAGVIHEYRLAVSNGAWTLYVDETVLREGTYNEGANYFYFVINPKGGTEDAFYLDDFAIAHAGGTDLDTFDGGKTTVFVESATKNSTFGSIGMSFAPSVFVEEESTEFAMKYNFNVTEKPSVTKKAYEGGSEVSFKYFIPAGTTTGGWWGIAWNDVAGNANNYHAAGIEANYVGHYTLSKVTGEWTDVSFTLPAGGPYYLYFGSDVGSNWKVDGANSYALIDDFTVNGEVERFTSNKENPLFNVVAGGITFGDGYVEKAFEEGEYSVKYGLNVHDKISFYTKKSYPAGTTVSFKYYLPSETTTKWWGWATAGSIAGADYYATASNGVGNTVGEWTTVNFTTASDGYIYLGFECGNWALDGGTPYILLDDFVIGSETENFNKGIDRVDEYDGCLFVTDASVCSLYIPVVEEPEIPEEPEEVIVTFETLLADGTIHEYLAHSDRVFYGKEISVDEGLASGSLAVSIRFGLEFNGERSFAILLSDRAFLYFDGTEIALYVDGEKVAPIGNLTQIDIGVKVDGSMQILIGGEYVNIGNVTVDQVRFVSLFGEGTVILEDIAVETFKVVA